jgi:hypothetical protein
VYPAYQHAHGQAKALLGKIALTPTVFWFGNWDKTRSVKAQVRDFLTNQTGGQSNMLAQIAAFRLTPWEGQACKKIPGRRVQNAYKRWIDQLAAGIGSSRVALILQPDLPDALCPPRHNGSSVYLGLVRYAAQKLNSLPYTTVYIDAGAADWISPQKAVWLLGRAGVQYGRGFSVNDTHLDSTSNELAYGANIIRLLNKKGITGKHFVVNTSTNGHPFLFYKRPGHGSPPACSPKRTSFCASLGIPPTTQTADPKWHLSAQANAIAAREADAYLWVGRPWLYRGAYPFLRVRALALAKSSPF